MQFPTQTTLIHQFRTNITIIRSKVNQNINNLNTNHIVHLNDRCLVFCMPVVHCCIDTWNTLTNIPNSLCLLCTVYLRLTTLILLTISPKVFLATCPTLQPTSTLTSMLFLLLWPMSLSSYIELLIWCNVLFLFYILRPCSFQLPLTFTFILPFPSLLRFILMLWLLIIMFQFPITSSSDQGYTQFYI